MSPWRCAPTPGSRSPPRPAARRLPGRAAAGPGTVTPPERGPAACGQRSAAAAENRHHQVTGSDDGLLIQLTVNEIRRLHTIFCRPSHPAAHYLRWSRWRRRHQARARHCHYQRRGQPESQSAAVVRDGAARDDGGCAGLLPRSGGYQRDRVPGPAQADTAGRSSAAPRANGSAGAVTTFCQSRHPQRKPASLFPHRRAVNVAGQCGPRLADWVRRNKPVQRSACLRVPRSTCRVPAGAPATGELFFTAGLTDVNAFGGAAEWLLFLLRSSGEGMELRQRGSRIIGVCAGGRYKGKMRAVPVFRATADQERGSGC